MLAAYGYRTAHGQGAHIAVGAFLRAIFDTPPGSVAAADYDSTRAARNGLRYQARSPSKAEASTAEAVAEGLLAGARARDDEAG